MFKVFLHLISCYSDLVRGAFTSETIHVQFSNSSNCLKALNFIKDELKGVPFIYTVTTDPEPTVFVKLQQCDKSCHDKQ